MADLLGPSWPDRLWRGCTHPHEDVQAWPVVHRHLWFGCPSPAFVHECRGRPLARGFHHSFQAGEGGQPQCGRHHQECSRSCVVEGKHAAPLRGPHERMCDPRDYRQEHPALREPPARAMGVGHGAYRSLAIVSFAGSSVCCRALLRQRPEGQTWYYLQTSQKCKGRSRAAERIAKLLREFGACLVGPRDFLESIVTQVLTKRVARRPSKSNCLDGTSSQGIEQHWQSHETQTSMALATPCRFGHMECVHRFQGGRSPSAGISVWGTIVVHYMGSVPATSVRSA